VLINVMLISLNQHIFFVYKVLAKVINLIESMVVNFF